MLDNPDIAAGIAAANVAEAKGLHTERAQAASATLKAWEAAYRPPPSATPADGIGAAARLEHLEKDAAFRNKLFAGDAATRAEFDRLNNMVAQADPAALAVAGHAAPNGVDENSGAVASTETMRDAAKDWDTFGVPKDQAQYFLSGGKYPESEYKLAEQTRDRCLADPEFMARWRAGDPGAKRLAWAWGAVLAAGFDPGLKGPLDR